MTLCLFDASLIRFVPTTLASLHFLKQARYSTLKPFHWVLSACDALSYLFQGSSTQVVPSTPSNVTFSRRHVLTSFKTSPLPGTISALLILLINSSIFSKHRLSSDILYIYLCFCLLSVPA
uniref:Uncharacterized protein n=1 Tax=Rousettus aegyptiacus TaxID=9407 RepID=A0A7J8DIN2_ROUAE|nr:hypothetical protein HJG63_008578 [Rousettus aegyptiacus]